MPRRLSPHHRERRGLVLQPLAPEPLAQGREFRPRPARGRDARRLRSGRGLDQGRAGGPRRLPYRAALVLLSRGAARAEERAALHARIPRGREEPLIRKPSMAAARSRRGTPRRDRLVPRTLLAWASTLRPQDRHAHALPWRAQALQRMSSHGHHGRSQAGDREDAEDPGRAAHAGYAGSKTSARSRST